MHALSSVQPWPFPTEGSWHVPASHHPDVQPLSSVQGPPSALTNPQVPSAQCEVRHCPSPLQGDPSGRPQTPPEQIIDAHSESLLQPDRFGCGSAQVRSQLTSSRQAPETQS
jgi:hypothetical protein